MSEQAPGRTAIIADRHALGRNLVRFLLEEEGFEISAEAATIAEVLLAVQHQAPDVLVVHENLAREHEPAVLEQIRRLSPNTNLVLLTGNRDTLAVELIFIADAVVEEGAGLGQLAFAAGWRAQTSAERAAAQKIARERRAARRRWRPQWGERLDTRGLVAASIVVLAVMLVRTAGFGPLPGADTPASAAPSIRAEGPALATTGSATSTTPFSGTNATSSADDPAGRDGTGPAGDPGDEPDPVTGVDPAPDPSGEPPPGPGEEPSGETSSDDSGAPPEDGSTVVDEVTDPVEGAVEDVVDEVGDVVEDVEGAVEDVVDEVEDTVDQVEGVVDEVEGSVDAVVEDVVDGGLSALTQG